MRANASGTRLFGFSAVIAALLLTALMVSAAPSYAVAHDVPGTPMGPGGASGVVDKVTSPQDVYAVYLFAGEPVAFVVKTKPLVPGYPARVALYPPGTLSVDVSSYLIALWGTSITYTPARSGVYYLLVGASRVGQGYTITVAGSESLPIFTTTTLSGPGKARVNRMLKLSGRLLPVEAPGHVKITKKRLVGKRWKTVGAPSVTPASSAAFTYSFKPGAIGRWRFVASYSAQTVGSSTYAPSKSRVLNVTVR